MGLSFEKLVNLLNPEYIHLSSAGDVEIDFVEIPSTYAQCTGKSLVLGRSDELLKVISPSKKQCAGIVGLGFSQKLIEICVALDLPLVFLSESTSLSEALYKLSHALLYHQQQCIQIEYLGNTTRDLSALLSAIFDLTGLEICLADSHFNLLESYPSTKEKSNNRWWPLQKIGTQYYNQVSKEISNRDRIIVNIDGFDYLVFQVNEGSILAVYSDGNLHSSTVIDCSIAALKMFFSRNRLPAPSDESLSEQVFGLTLDGVYVADTLVTKALKEIGFGPGGVFYYGKVVPKDVVTTASFNYRGLRAALLQVFPSALVLFRNDALHVLIDISKTDDPSINVLSDQLTPVLQQHRAVMGISNRFRNYTFLQTVRQQPQKALDIGRVINPSYSVHPFGFYVLYEMIEICSSFVDINQFIHPVVQYLREYDIENGTEYVATLQAYFNSDRKIQKAADHLCIHKNTFLYRMERIRALTKVDFSSEYRGIHLQISCSICKWIDRKNNEIFE